MGMKGRDRCLVRSTACPACDQGDTVVVGVSFLSLLWMRLDRSLVQPYPRAVLDLEAGALRVFPASLLGLQAS